MSIEDLKFLAIEGYLQIKVWSLSEDAYVFEGEIADLDDSDVDTYAEVCSWELGTTEDGEPYLGINID